MLLTEREAKRKSCPLKKELLGYCEGSICMAWRWANKTVHVDGELQTIQVGFCGLAGKPE